MGSLRSAKPDLLVEIINRSGECHVGVASAARMDRRATARVCSAKLAPDPRRDEIGSCYVLARVFGTDNIPMPYRLRQTVVPPSGSTRFYLIGQLLLKVGRDGAVILFVPRDKRLE